MKSANVFLGKDLRAKIADFGFVRATTEEREPINTKCVGTPGYMAPEYMGMYFLFPLLISDLAIYICFFLGN